MNSQTVTLPNLHIKAFIQATDGKTPAIVIHDSTMAAYLSESIFTSLHRTAHLLDPGLELHIITERVE